MDVRIKMRNNVCSSIKKKYVYKNLLFFSEKIERERHLKLLKLYKEIQEKKDKEFLEFYFDNYNVELDSNQCTERS